MVRRKITYYKMLTPERPVEIAAAVGATDLCSQHYKKIHFRDDTCLSQ